MDQKLPPMLEKILKDYQGEVNISVIHEMGTVELGYNSRSEEASISFRNINLFYNPGGYKIGENASAADFLDYVTNQLEGHRRFRDILIEEELGKVSENLIGQQVMNNMLKQRVLRVAQKDRPLVKWLIRSGLSIERLVHLEFPSSCRREIMSEASTIEQGMEGYHEVIGFAGLGKAYLAEHMRNCSGHFPKESALLDESIGVIEEIISAYRTLVTKGQELVRELEISGKMLYG